MPCSSTFSTSTPASSTRPMSASRPRPGFAARRCRRAAPLEAARLAALAAAQRAPRRGGKFPARAGNERLRLAAAVAVARLFRAAARAPPPSRAHGAIIPPARRDRRQAPRRAAPRRQLRASARLAGQTTPATSRRDRSARLGRRDLRPGKIWQRVIFTASADYAKNLYPSLELFYAEPP